MQPRNETEFEWIAKSRQPSMGREDRNWTGNFVSNLMPATFKAYSKILHRIDGWYENIDNPLSPREVSLLKIPACEKLKKFVQDRRNLQQSRIRWKELAELLNVPFAPEINDGWYRTKLEEGCWPRFLHGPNEGALEEEEYLELARVLRVFTESAECFFRFADIPFIGEDRPLLFKGGLEEIASFLKTGAFQFSPEYWWPPEHDWCVCTEYDLAFTVVGGPVRLISALLENPVLECLEVTAQARIDSFAPIPRTAHLPDANPNNFEVD